MSPAIGTPPEDMQLAEDNGMPAILVARSMDGLDLPTYRGDDSYGISLATNHLIGLGHRSIAMIGGTDQTSTGRDRYQGYVNALRKAGIDVDPGLRIPGPRSMQGGFEAAVHFLSLPQKPTAAVCWNDLVAIGLMNGIARAGLVPGNDISVTGYDDLEEASISMPALTTVWNGQAEVGRLAARALLDRLAGSHEPDGHPSHQARDAHPPVDKPLPTAPVSKPRGNAMSRIAVLVPGKIHERVLTRLKERFDVIEADPWQSLDADCRAHSRRCRLRHVRRGRDRQPSECRG